jgi:hypothetical protein
MMRRSRLILAVTAAFVLAGCASASATPEPSLTTAPVDTPETPFACVVGLPRPTPGSGTPIATTTTYAYAPVPGAPRIGQTQQEGEVRTVKTFLIGGLATASLIAALAAPTTAADTKGTLAIVNGVPGQKVDVCLDGKEIRSGLAYGNKVQRPLVATGDKTIRFYRPDPRRCRGTLIARRQFSLPPAADLTIVVTKNAPRIVVFDNAGLGEIPPLGVPTPFAPFAFRHAADIAADIGYRFWTPPGTDASRTPSAIFTKGQESRSLNVLSGFVPASLIQARAAIVGSPQAIVSPIIEIFVSHRYEWVLVGTSYANARWVFMDRLVSQPSP